MGYKFSGWHRIQDRLLPQSLLTTTNTGFEFINSSSLRCRHRQGLQAGLQAFTRPSDSRSAANFAQKRKGKAYAVRRHNGSLCLKRQPKILRMFVRIKYSICREFCVQLKGFTTLSTGNFAGVCRRNKTRSTATFASVCKLMTYD